MDSMPPATAISDVPNMMAWAASATAFSPLPQTMLIVSALTVSASPPRSAACLAGFCPSPAGSTHPITHSSILSAETPARRTASRTTIAPSSTALMSLSAPRNLPTGVRTALTITTSFMTNTSVSASTGPNHKINRSSFRRHAQRTVQADCFAVQHGLHTDACNKLRKLLRLSQALRKQNCLRQRLLHFGRKARHHRSHEQPWSNGHNANAKPRKFARSRKRHPRYTGLRRCISDLSHLAFKRCDGRGVDNHSTLAVRHWLVAGHGIRPEPEHVERAHKIDGHCAAEAFQAVRPIPPSDSLTGSDASAIHQSMQRSELCFRCRDRSNSIRFLRNIGRNKARGFSKFFCQRIAGGIDVCEYNVAAALHEHSRSCLAKS